MRTLTFDCETTNLNKGHVYDSRNQLVLSGYLSDDSNGDNCTYASIEGSERPGEVSRLFERADCFVGFNLKFDLAWIRRAYGIFPVKQVWDCQLAEFIYSGQTLTYPSLNQCCERYGLPQKLDVVKTEYWDKGLSTLDVPADILAEYLEQDVRITHMLYEAQKDHPQAKLVRQMGWDLLCLSEMEHNGMLYDRAASLSAADGLKVTIDRIHADLNSELGATINWGSPKQVAAVLFGGVIEEQYKEEYLFTYKDGKKPPVMKSRNAVREVLFPQLTPSIKDSPGGAPSVDDEVLNKIPKKGKAGRIVKLLLERAAIAKLEGTYYRGIPKKMEEYHWQNETIHGNINQTSVVTGRTSSNNPNLQNIPSEAKQFFISRFD